MSWFKMAWKHLWSWTKENIISWDLYPRTVTFTYDGHSKYKSFIGGVVSLIIDLAVFIITVLSIVMIFQRGNTSTSVNKIAKDLTDDQEKHYFSQNNEVYFAFKLIGPTPEKLLDKTYLLFEIQQNGYTKNNITLGSQTNTIKIEYEYWGSKFPHVSENVYNRVDLSSYLWPKNTDFFIRSNFNSDNYEIIEVNLMTCSGDNWKSDNEILELLQTHTLSIALLSSFFDFDDYDNPVHHYLQDTNIYSLIPYLQQTLEYKVKQNQATLEDSIWIGNQAESSQINFYSAYKHNYLITGARYENNKFIII